jgi:ectoine hydroxylase-related dioxygenase (phytanoyl-CoA dioxygenase family)
MNTNISHEEVEFYRKNGYVVMHDFLSQEELQEWRDAVTDAVTDRGQQRILGQMGKPNEYYENVFVQRVNLWQDNPKVRKLMLDARLGKIAATLAGVEGIRIWHDQALIKKPYANPTAWHLDNPYWSFYSRDALTIWVALDDVTIENGCLWFLPGTHSLATYDNVGIGHNMGDLFKVYEDWAKIPAVPVTIKAGSCSWHNGLIAHAAGPNMTVGFRRAFTCAYMPDGSTFNGQRNILRDEQVANLQVGDVLEDDAQTPLIYHPTKPIVAA